MLKIKKKQILYILQIVITISLLYIIFKKIDISKTTALLKNANLLYLGLALCMDFFFNFLSIYRWYFSLLKIDIYIKYLKLLRFHYIALFLQNFLPSFIGGDLVKGVLAFKGNPKIRVASSILVSRISGLFALVVLANIAFLLSGSISNSINQIKYYSLLVLVLFIILFILLFNKKTQVWFIKKYNSINIKTLKNFKIEIFFEKINLYKNIRIVFILLFSSFVIQIFSFLSNYFFFLSIGNNINISHFFLYSTIVTFIIILPISINGHGLREGLYYYFFCNLGFSKNSIITFALLVLIRPIIASLIGSTFLLFKTKNK